MQHLDTMQARHAGKMRDVQTELRRGFAALSECQTIRMRKIEADQSNFDVALSGRVHALERRRKGIRHRLV